MKIQLSFLALTAFSQAAVVAKDIASTIETSSSPSSVPPGCLDPSLIQTASNRTGQERGTPGVEPGEVSSEIDTTNFINFCAGRELTNGRQLSTSSCNGIPMGRIPAHDRMIASLITSPATGERLPAHMAFNITIHTVHLTAGYFANPLASYYSAPQDLDENGNIYGHCHVTVQELTVKRHDWGEVVVKIPDPRKFVFFTGISDAGDGRGRLQATVVGGLPVGHYRVCTMIAARNHQPVMMPVAQRGAQDDCVRFQVIDGDEDYFSGNSADRFRQQNSKSFTGLRNELQIDHSCLAIWEMQSTTFRACEACRILKVRCEPASGGGHDGSISSNDGTVLPPVSERPPCRRCRDIGHECVYTERRRTKRKRTDVRVRELEQEVWQLGELLFLQQKQQQQQSGDAGGVLVEGVQEVRVPERSSPIVEESLPTVPSLPPAFAISSAGTPSPNLPLSWNSSLPATVDSADPVAAGLLPMAWAVRLFRRYVLTMAPQRPLVVFPAVTPANHHVIPTDEEIAAVAAKVRRQTPVLFLAIVTVAGNIGAEMGQNGDDDDDDDDDELSNGRDGSADISNDESDGLSLALEALLLRVFAERIMLDGQKSIELIQALLVSSNWNCHSLGVTPPSSHRPRFYQHVHLAASMAVELGLCGREGQNRPQDSGPSGDTLVFERTLLACYLCCSSVSLGFHRQSMLSFTPHIAECLATIETSALAAPTDATLAAWVRLQHIVDNAAVGLGLRSSERDGAASSTDKATRGLVDFADPCLQMNLQNATLQLEQWRQSVTSTCMNNSLLIQYHTVLCTLHESCFYNEFDPTDFKPPYRVAVPTCRANAPVPPQRPKPRPFLTSAHIQSRQLCLASARALIGIFLAAPTKQLRGMPVFSYARISYAIVVLLKLELSAVLPGGAMHGLMRHVGGPGSSTTQIHHYLGKLSWRMRQLRTRHRHLARMWAPLVEAVSEWYEGYLLPAAGGHISDEKASTASGVGPVLRPLRHCFPLLTQSEGQASTAAARLNPESAMAPASLVAPIGVSGFYEMLNEIGYRESAVPIAYENGTTEQDLEQTDRSAGGDTSSVSRAPAHVSHEDEQLLQSMLLMGDTIDWTDPSKQFFDVQSCLDGMFSEQMST
ncbi:fungal transcriptional regulatory protein [Grosmannia clavigera kw1407]|uniref:Fungal transcriptional regulatory protein n=1 Tax=Grosmannia clavigera (strain kw1407 / UAMH 11150) TaxID=655863 RepID=F0XJT9_GROCL|nr:fungal transcriptional regulatory protein [Grosmannia clavigera kw1407]EFX02303.1 fungal transcriptional regulatory protein [Grosmannia clavigera kw1407]